MVRRRLSLPFTDVKEDNEVIADEEINIYIYIYLATFLSQKKIYIYIIYLVKC